MEKYEIRIYPTAKKDMQEVVSYLNTLSVGEHRIDIVFADGEASGEFTVQAETTKPDVPVTGESSVIFWIAVIFVSAGAGVVLSAYRKKKGITK